jgi:hypothetical protein
MVIQVRQSQKTAPQEPYKQQSAPESRVSSTLPKLPLTDNSGRLLVEWLRLQKGKLVKSGLPPRATAVTILNENPSDPQAFFDCDAPAMRDVAALNRLLLESDLTGDIDGD